MNQSNGSDRARRRVFVAGAMGVVGQAVMKVNTNMERVPHVRPKRANQHPFGAEARVFDLSSRTELEDALRGCTTVMQLIGTMRSRFAQGDTYQSSDIDTTRLLLEASSRVGVDHFILLTSVGAGRPIGAYLRAKAEAERLVTSSGIPYTVFRPSALEGPGRPVPPGVGFATRLLGMKRFEPITVSTLALAMVVCAERRAPLQAALEGQPLWDLSAQRGT